MSLQTLRKTRVALTWFAIVMMTISPTFAGGHLLNRLRCGGCTSPELIASVTGRIGCFAQRLGSLGEGCGIASLRNRLGSRCDQDACCCSCQDICGATTSFVACPTQSTSCGTVDTVAMAGVYTVDGGHDSVVAMSEGNVTSNSVYAGGDTQWIEGDVGMPQSAESCCGQIVDGGYVNESAAAVMDHTGSYAPESTVTHEQVIHESIGASSDTQLPAFANDIPTDAPPAASTEEASSRSPENQPVTTEPVVVDPMPTDPASPEPASPEPAPSDPVPSDPIAPEPSAAGNEPEGTDENDPADDLFSDDLNDAASTPAGDDLFPAEDSASGDGASGDLPADVVPTDPPATDDDVLGDDFFDDLDTSTETPLRSWVDNTGIYRVQARLLQISTDSVRLLKTNGRTCTVPIRRLSRRDFAHVQFVASKQGLAPPNRLAAK